MFGKKIKDSIRYLIQKIGCGTGYYGYYSVYPDATGCECQICPIGTYNSEESAQSCTSCPPGLTTMESGTDRSWKCRAGKIIKHVQLSA